jgi:excisionase family DNA binding protein
MQDMQDRRRDRERTDPRLLTATEVGRSLGVDASTVYRMAAAGRLPGVKVGRQWRFHAAGIDELLSRPEVRPSLDATSLEGTLRVVAELLGVALVVTDMSGQLLTGIVNPCPWLAARLDDPQVLSACSREWSAMADELNLEPEFRTGALGFQCARSYLRNGPSLVGMVLAGGVAPDGSGTTATDGLYHLDGPALRRVLTALPRVAAALSRPAPVISAVDLVK